MKVAVFNNSNDILYDKMMGRPFSFNIDKIEILSSLEDADYILGYIGINECNKLFTEICQTKEYEKYSHKFVFMAIHDNPKFAYKDKKSIKFIAQPLHNHLVNSEHNVIVHPIQMRKFEYEIIKDTEFIEELRQAPKEYDFTFIGNMTLPNRGFLRNINYPMSNIRHGKKIWKLQKIEDRVPVLKDFYRELARSRFSFCPRGVGSSSFRLYQSLMVGSIPIVFGMNDYPFEKEVDWDSFSIRNISKTTDFEQYIKNVDYDSMRRNGMDFWDRFVDMRKCDERLFQILKNRLG